MSGRKRVAIIFLVVFVMSGVLVGSSMLWGYLQSPRSGASDTRRTIVLAGETLYVDIADTEALRERGLGGREMLASDEGMLFIFEQDGPHAFWMKGMRVSIDIVWISSSGIVVDIRESVAPESYPTVFVPRQPARYVVELPEGFVRAHGVAVGDIVEFR